MTEFYDIIGNLKTVLDAQPFVNTVTTGGLEDVDLNKQTIFPLSHIIVNSAIPKSSTIVFNISIIAMDIVDESKQETSDIFVGNDNEQDVLNQQLQVLNQVYQQLRHGQLFSELIQVTAEPNCEPFTDRFENKLAGWTMTFDVEVPNDMTICGTSIPSNCLDAFIQNSDGSFSASLASGSHTTFEDITLQVFNSNENLIDEIVEPSNKDFQYLIPDTEVVLKDTLDNIISTTNLASSVSGNITAPDGAITVNGSSVGGVNSNGTRALLVKLNGTNSGVYDGVNTINVTDKNLFIKGVFKIANEAMDQLIIDSESAGTYTSTTNDGSSGTITFRKNGSTISLPFTLAINDTLDVSRSVTTSNGWFKLVGTYA